MKVGYQENLPNCCGVNDIGGWNDCDQTATRPWSNETYTIGEDLIKSGTGLLTATFVNNRRNKEKYEELCREHKLLYQSPVKRNSRSNRRLFLCVFQWKAPRQQRNKLPKL